MKKRYDYIESFIQTNNPVINRLADEYNNRIDISPCIGLQSGRFITWLISLTKAKKIVEFGTCIGYSTVVLADAAKNNNGSLIAIEKSPNHCKEALENLKEANLDKYVEIINGKAEIELEKLEEPIDFILQDSLKAIYPQMLDICIRKLKSGGIIVADDTLFKPMGIKEKFSKFMHEYNELVFSDSRIFSTILPIGDGLTISYKK
jgi:predicted O-methyltransferase YrrM